MIIPFAFASYYPTLEYLEKSENNLMVISLVIVIIIWFIAIKVWNFALGKYRSTGN